jgi:hypothetical protein
MIPKTYVTYTVNYLRQELSLRDHEITTGGVVRA